jgi:hypothetical protein
MLIVIFATLTIVVVLGSVLALPYLQAEGRTRPSWPLAALHGLLGIGGFGCLVLVLKASPRGLDQTTGSFGIIAATLIAPAILLGIGFAVARLRGRKPSAILIGIHATLAVSGFVVLSAYIFAG